MKHRSFLLELTPERFRPKLLPAADLRIARAVDGDQARAGFLWTEVGRDYAVERMRGPVASTTFQRHGPSMRQSLGLASLVVREYDEAIEFYVGTLGFTLVEDTYIPEQNKRWVVVAPPGATESRLLLARAVGDEQSSRIGNQTGGRVFLFLHTDDFWRDFRAYTAKGVTFVREPKEETYGTVAVFKDLYGNLWDLLQPTR